MSSNKAFRFGPIALTTTLTTNLLNPPTATGGVNAGAAANFITLKHLRISNKTTSPATFSMWLGASGANAAGSEFVGVGVNVPALASYDWYSPGSRISATEFIVGGSNTANALTVSGEGEIGVS